MDDRYFLPRLRGPLVTTGGARLALPGARARLLDFSVNSMFMGARL